MLQIFNASRKYSTNVCEGGDCRYVWCVGGVNTLRDPLGEILQFMYFHLT
jgi:hypothetical protein